MTLAELNASIITRLTPSRGDREARAIARMLLEDTIGATPMTVFTRGERLLEPETVARISALCGRIAAGEPPQYVVGRARFMGLDIEVTPAVLIPRPETAGLVDLITDDYAGRTDLEVIDIGTGSGCIAIALSRALPFARVEAVDISTDAIAVARGNAERLSARIDFRQLDILSEDLGRHADVDIVVSNPPYIAMHEKAAMDSGVTDYEPGLALFVPDSDPLEFYRAIGYAARRALRPGGGLYFEINPLYVSDLRKLLFSQGYVSVDILRDYLGRERFARACSPL